MANDTVYCTFDELMALIEPDFRPICRTLRAIITQQHPEFVEIIWEKQRIASYGIGPKRCQSIMSTLRRTKITSTSVLSWRSTV